ncbi:MAG: peptidoglycan-binding protein [Phormidesmis sp.]
METKLEAFKGSKFIGKTVLADVEFLPALEKVNRFAADHDLEIFVTSSARQHGASVGGAIVRPASRSNHLVGHAIDMNIRHGGKHFNSLNLKQSNFSLLPLAIQSFINSIRKAPLRWGGDFNDPVHIDDGLNIHAPAVWSEKFDTIQRDLIALTQPGFIPGQARLLFMTKPFMRGEDVLALQTVLIRRGFDLIPDKIFGPGTDAAVTAFQTREGLTADGIVGAQTLKALGLLPVTV